MRGRGRGEEERERKEREKKEIHVHVLVTVHSFFNESPPTEISLQIVNLPPNLAQYLMINTSRGGRFFFSDKWRKRKIPTLQLNSRILGRKRGRERGWDQKLKVARISGRGGEGEKGLINLGSSLGSSWCFSCRWEKKVSSWREGMDRLHQEKKDEFYLGK